MKVGVIIFLMTFGWPAVARDLPTTPADSPVSWAQADAEAAIDRETARRIGDEALGRAAAGYEADMQLVRFYDRDGFGEVLSGQLTWLIRYTGIEGAGFSRHVNLVVSADDGRFLGAFTDAREEWIAPFGTQRDPEEMNDNWKVLPLGTAKPILAVTDVLAEVWQSRMGLALEAGQIIMRPRVIDLSVPARVVNGELEPIHSPGIRWLVHILGALACELHPPPVVGEDGSLRGPPEDSIPYFTGQLVLIDDTTGEYIMATCTD